jgi:AcrR family transcriptional regulator
LASGSDLTAVSDAVRRRNPRGQGQRLREELLQAARDLVTESGDPQALSLGAAAKRVGIAAPSAYRHFPDARHLKIAVVRACFADLAHARSVAAEGLTDPGAALLARAHAYCRFALANPGLYQLMFGPDPQLPHELVYESGDSPGRAAFHDLAESIRTCQDTGVARITSDPLVLAATVWSLEHGMVSLRINRPHFPWPDLDSTLTEALTRLLDLQPPPPPHGQLHR